MANTHQIAHRAAPEARVVYVDVDPLVSTSAAALMAGRGVVTLRADLREPEQVLSNAQVRDLLDFGQPVGIMFMCVLHCLWDREDPWGVVAQDGDQQAGVAAAHVDDVAKCAPGVSSSYSGRGYAELPGPGGAAFLLDLDSAA
jgi:S-adenosyl methyltransferase